jgi:hypothetical protein
MRRPLVIGLLLASLFVGPGPSSAAPVPNDVYLIDTHSQVEGSEVSLVIQVMDRGGVYRMLLSAIGDLPQRAVIDLAQQSSGRIIPAVTTKGPGYATANPGPYYARLASQINSGQFAAMAEVLIYHAAKADGSPAKIVSPQDQQVQTALQNALTRGWPFIMHIEFAAIAALDGSEERAKFMRQFEAVVSAHPEHPFLLTHMGQLRANEVERLILAHPNLHFQTSATIPGLAARSGQPWVNLFSGSVLAPEWRRLVIAHPDRFVFAIDCIGNGFRHPEAYCLRSVAFWRWALGVLPRTVAEAVAHGNAERIWKLPPKTP